MKKCLWLVLILVLTTGISEAASKKFSDLMKDESFAKATAEERLFWVQSKLVKKEFTSSDVNGDLITRLFHDRLKDEKTADARITVYGSIRNKAKELPSTYELEAYLAEDFLAETPEAKKADLVGMMKALQKLADEKKISWPGQAPLHEGMLCAHLATNAEFQKMSPKEKAAYFKKLNDDKVLKDITSSRFNRGFMGAAMRETAPDKQKALFDELAPLLDFFTKSAIQGSFEP